MKLQSCTICQLPNAMSQVTVTLLILFSLQGAVAAARAAEAAAAEAREEAERQLQHVAERDAKHSEVSRHADVHRLGMCNQTCARRRKALTVICVISSDQHTLTSGV